MGPAQKKQLSGKGQRTKHALAGALHCAAHAGRHETGDEAQLVHSAQHTPPLGNLNTNTSSKKCKTTTQMAHTSEPISGTHSVRRSTAHKTL
jgi:hypothetical protein